jgi:hypothetical protein
MIVVNNEAVVWIDVEADRLGFFMASLGARCYYVTPMSTYGAHRTT